MNVPNYFFVSGNFIIQNDENWNKVQYQDVFILCDTSAGAVNIILPQISQDFLTTRYHISDCRNNAALNNITISTSGTDTINEGSSVIIATNGCSVICFQNSSSLGGVISKWVALYSNQSGLFGMNSYGSFYDTTTQIASGNNQVDALRLNSTDSSATNGISVVNDSFGYPTKITVTKTSIYNIQFSAQLNRTTGGTPKQISIWLRRNGLDLANTNTHISVQANANKLVAAWNLFVRLNAGDNAQLMWTTQDTNIQLLHEPVNLTIPHPETPSLILTITEV